MERHYLNGIARFIPAINFAEVNQVNFICFLDTLTILISKLQMLRFLMRGETHSLLLFETDK